MSENCHATTKRGTPCQAPAMAGSPFCSFHANPDRAAELGRMGGRKNRHYVETEEITISPPSTPEDIKTLLSQAMVDVRKKKLDPRTAHTLTYMSSILLKAIDGTDVHRRLTRLEEDRLKRGEPIPDGS